MKTRHAQQQTCKICGQPDKFDFSISDDMWEAVLPAELQHSVVCIYCFDEKAHERNVDYAPSLETLYFEGQGAAFELRMVDFVSKTLRRRRPQAGDQIYKRKWREV